MKEIDIINLLKSYKVCKKFVQAQEYAKTYFDPIGTQEISKSEQCEARMNTIECLIQLLAPSEEYTLLHLHYIKGIPVISFIPRKLVCRKYVYINKNRLPIVKQGTQIYI